MEYYWEVRNRLVTNIANWFWQSSKAIQLRKGNLLINSAGLTGYPYEKQMDINPYFTSLQKFTENES